MMDNETDMLSERQLVESYRASWEAVIPGSEPLEELVPYFHVPCFMVSNAGTMSHYTSQSEISQFNRSRLEAFRAGGVHNANLRAVDEQSQGPYLTLAVVNWELTREDNSLERAWRHYYTILASPENAPPKIVVSAFQTGS